MLTKQPDIELIMRRELNPAEVDLLPQLDNEARFLIEGYTQEIYDENFPLDIPVEVITVANRLVSRALSASPDNEGVATRQQSTGPFSNQVTYVAGGGSGMYLGKAEKQMLKRRRQGFQVISLGNY